MNETINTILNRRSTRKFQQIQIKDEELDAILNAGKYAPTAFSQQSWHFTVVQNQELLKKITEIIRDSVSKSDNSHLANLAKSENFAPFYSAPTVIIVTADEKAHAPIHDGTLALGNMLLAAESLGLGACWVDSIKAAFVTEESKKLKEELGIPEGYIPVGSAIFGYKDMKSINPAPRKENTINIIR